MGFYKSCYATRLLQAELLALEQGLKIALDMSFPTLEIESDSSDMIKTINEDNALTNNTLLNCRLLMHRLKISMIRHNFREGNAVADRLAKEAIKHFNPNRCFYPARPPLFVETVLEKDMQGLCFGSRLLSTNVCNSLVALNNSNVLRDYIVTM
ncbi:uncharacterized protein [Nicotiana tomentosiformis]|uniref:uncharacterized protein n=1 Tax=Nicotiana tomentosiformis TaxID=4098 RepID=UPI00388CE664